MGTVNSLKSLSIDNISNIQFLLIKLPLHDRVEEVMTGGLISV